MWAKKQGAKIKTQKASGVGTKSILRGRGELQARRAKQPEPGGEHRSKLVKNCGGRSSETLGGAAPTGVGLGRGYTFMHSGLWSREIVQQL